MTYTQDTLSTQCIHLSTQLSLAFTLLRMVPLLRNADVSNCIFASGVCEYSRHFTSWRKLFSRAAVSPSTDDGTNWLSSQLSESNCETKLISQVASGGIDRYSMSIFDVSNMSFSQWSCFSICKHNNIS